MVSNITLVEVPDDDDTDELTDDEEASWAWRLPTTLPTPVLQLALNEAVPQKEYLKRCPWDEAEAERRVRDGGQRPWINTTNLHCAGLETTYSLRCCSWQGQQLRLERLAEVPPISHSPPIRLPPAHRANRRTRIRTHTTSALQPNMLALQLWVWQVFVAAALDKALDHVERARRLVAGDHVPGVPYHDLQLFLFI